MAVDEQLRAQAIPGFRFVVLVNNELQAAFTECTLPDLEWETEEIKEGGLNQYTHQLPVRRRSARLTLKNGVGKSQLMTWYIQTMSGKFERRTISVSLLDMGRNRIITWELRNGYPVKWTGPQLRSDDTSIAIQTLEFVGQEVIVEMP